MSPETFELACKVFHERNVPIEHLTYRARGVFTGRELYFYDPSGNRLELRDPTWVEGMPETPFEELATASTRWWQGRRNPDGATIPEQRRSPRMKHSEDLDTRPPYVGSLFASA